MEAAIGKVKLKLKVRGREGEVRGKLLVKQHIM